MTAHPCVIRPAQAGDIARIHELNASALPHVSEVEPAFFTGWLDGPARLAVAEANNEVVGFMLSHLPEANYDSLNFLWFKKRYDSFVYVDRVVVDAAARGLGIGTALYEDVADFARGRAPVVACEVNTRPPNEPSMAFHQGLGFSCVGEQDTEGGKKRVALLAKNV